jgi:hypothetical protein
MTAESSLWPNRIQSRKPSQDSRFLEDERDFVRIQFIQ